MNDLYEQGTPVIMNTYNRFPIVLEKGDGCYVYDANGTKYLDFVAGISVNALGHGHRKLCRAIAEQAEKLIHVSNLYWTGPQVELARKLIDISGFDRVFFCNSGTEAIESCMKLARKYASKNGSGRYEIISALNSFHGRTFGALTATGQEKYQKGLGPMLPGVIHVKYNDFAALQAAMGEKTCAVLLEVLQVEGGFNHASKEYLQNVRKLCDENGVMLIFDEVQSGVGRTGTFYAFEQLGVRPDAVAMAKGLAGGVPIGAALAAERFAEAFAPGDHASTFGGNPLACSAALAVLEELFEGGVMEKVGATGAHLKERLNTLCAKHGVIKEARGMGLAQAIELKTEAAPIIRACLAAGLLLVNAGTHIIRFVPPLIVTNGQIDDAIDILDGVLEKEGKQ